MGIMDAVEGIGYALDTPRALAHGAVANIADAVRGRKSRDSWRASGRDMLESLGVLDANQEGLDAGDVAGMGAEMFLDPLNLVGAGIATKLLKGNKLRNLTKKIPKTFNESQYLTQLADEIPVDAKVVPEIGGVGAPEIAALMGNGPVYQPISPDTVRQMMTGGPVGKLREISARTPFEAQVIPELPLSASVQPGIAQAMSAAAPKKQPWVRPDLPPDAPSRFYSRLERAVEALPGKQIKSHSVMKQIKKYPEGVSQEEIDWTDVAGFLKGKDVVSKDELVAYVKANRPKIETEEGFGKYYPYTQGQQYGDDFQYKHDGSKVPGSYTESLQILKNPKNKPTQLTAEPLKSRFPVYYTNSPEHRIERYSKADVTDDILAGLSDGRYKPNSPVEHAYLASGIAPEKFALAMTDPHLVHLPGGSFRLADSLDEAKSIMDNELGGYASHNFPEAKNPLLHSRSTIRKTPIGKMLLGEEQQSDWLQDASKLGFYDEPLAKAKWSELIGDHGTVFDSQYGIVRPEASNINNWLGSIGQPQSSEFGSVGSPNSYNSSVHPPFDAGGGDYKSGISTLEEAKQFILDKAEANKHLRPPQAPMRDTWSELALKQHLIDAASDPSVKYVGLPSGEDVAAVVGGEAGGQAQFYNKDQVARLKKLLEPFGVDVEDVAGAVAEHPGADARAEKVSALLKKTKDRRDESGSYTNDYRFTDAIAKMLDRHGYNVGGDRGVNDLVNNPIPKEQLAKNLKESLADKFQRRYGAAKLAKITPEMRKQILTKGFPLMSPLAAALLAPALMDRDES